MESLFSAPDVGTAAVKADTEAGPRVVGLATSRAHRFSKESVRWVEMQRALGVRGDCHAGRTVQHLSRLRREPASPNLRQVHVIQAELFDALLDQGHRVRPGELGENVTTRGVDLLSLPTGTRLGLGAEAEIEITGLRNPCVQIDRFDAGLLAMVLSRNEAGRVVRKAGVMGVVTRGGVVTVGDGIDVVLPPLPHLALSPV